MRRRMRWIVPLAVLLGLVATLAFAWFPRNFGFLRSVRRAEATQQLWFGEKEGLWWSVTLREERSGGWVRAIGYRTREFGEEQHARYVEIAQKSSSSTFVDGFEWPAWSRFESLVPRVKDALAQPDVRSDGSALLNEYSAGWPSRALAGASWKAFDGAPRSLSQEGMRKIGDDFRPTRVLVIGLALNIVILSAAAAAVLAAIAVVPGAVRGFVRKRGGRCAGCGYERAGLAADAKCPECGTS